MSIPQLSKLYILNVLPINVNAKPYFAFIKLISETKRAGVSCFGGCFLEITRTTRTLGKCVHYFIQLINTAAIQSVTCFS